MSLNHIEIEKVEEQYKRISKWISTFDSPQQWNQFCRDVGIYELQNCYFHSWKSLIEHYPSFATYRDVAHLGQQRIQKLNWLINVVPYGAGSSFIGALQSWLLWGTVLNTVDRTRNLWDNDFGPLMTHPLDAYPENTKVSSTRFDAVEIEECIQDMLGNHKTFHDLSQKYYTLLNKGLIENRALFNECDDILIEVTVHDYYIMFELMANSRINLFVDVDKETFEQCFFLATAKHNGTAFKRWLNKEGPDDFDYNSIDFPHCQQSWKLYSIVKKYLPKMYKLNYQKFVVEQDHETVKQFINRTLKVKDPIESQIKHIRDELKIYNDRNNELLENNNYERWRKEYQLYE